MDPLIRFVTFYPNCTNSGLLKDVGQIPNTLGLNYPNVEAKLVCTVLNLNDPNIEKLRGVRIEKIKSIFFSDFLTGLVYIFKNAKKVDWFNFYHGGRKVYYWTKLYKFLNPKGKVYLKLDLGIAACKLYESINKELEIFEKTNNAVDLVSIESEKICNYANSLSNCKFMLIPNGYIDIKSIEVLPISKRKKEFITVGRLGTPPKATDLLLNAFYESSTFHDWNLRLVGPIDDSFKDFVDKFFKKYPSMNGRVIFEGPVFDKDTLYCLYNNARVFVLPSLWEGFPLVGPEALHNGCRMLLSDAIPPFTELTNNGEFGISFKSGVVKELSNALISETNRHSSESEPSLISNYAKSTLSWSRICERLFKEMFITD